MSRFDEKHLDCIDPTSFARIDIIDSLDFTEKEQDFLRGKRHLARIWGYRSNHGRHERFEEKSLECRSFQFYSDLVFRALQQQELFSSDLDLVKNAASTSLKECGETASQLMRAYLAEPTVASSFLDLADQILHDGNTKAFAAIVVAARALICIANGSFRQAQSHMVLLSQSIFGSNDDDEDESDDWSD